MFFMASILNAINKVLYPSLQILLFAFVLFFFILFIYFFLKRRCVKCNEKILFNRYYIIDKEIICEKCKAKEKYEVVFSFKEKEIAYSLDLLEKKEEKHKKQYYENYKNFIIKNSKQLFAIFIFFFILSSIFVSSIPKNYNAIYVSSITESEKANEILENNFPYFAKENKIIVVLNSDNVKDNKTKNEILQFTNAIEKRGNVYSVYSIYENAIENSLQKLNKYLFLSSEENNYFTIRYFEGETLKNNSVIFYLPSLFLNSWNTLEMQLDERNKISYEFAISQFQNFSFLSNEEKNLSLKNFNLFYEYWKETFNNSYLIKLTSSERANHCINLTYNSSVFNFNIENWDNETSIHNFAIFHYSNKTKFSEDFIEKAYYLGSNPPPQNIKNLTREIIEKNSIVNYPLRLIDVEKNFISEDGKKMIILVEFSGKNNDEIKDNVNFVKENLKFFSSEVYLQGDYYTTSENIFAYEDYFKILAIIIILCFLILLFAFRSIIIPIILSAIALISFSIHQFLFYFIAKISPFNHFTIIGVAFLFSIFYFFSIILILKFKERIKDENTENAISETLKTNGKVISLISLTLFVFSIPFYFSSFVEIKIISLSFLIAILVSFLSVFLFLPSLILLLKGRIFYPSSIKIEKFAFENYIKRILNKNSVIFIIILLLISAFAFYSILKNPIEKSSEEKLFIVVRGQNLYSEEYNLAMYNKIYDFTKNVQKIKDVKQISSPILQNGKFLTNEYINELNLKEKIEIEEKINFYHKDKIFVIEIYLKENLNEEEKTELIQKVKTNAKDMKLNADVYVGGKLATKKDYEYSTSKDLFFAFLFISILIFGILLFYFNSIFLSLKLILGTFISSTLSIYVSTFLISPSLTEFQIILILTFSLIFAINFIFAEKIKNYAIFLIFAIAFSSMLLFNKNYGIAILIATLFSFVSYLFIMPTLLSLRRKHERKSK